MVDSESEALEYALNSRLGHMVGKSETSVYNVTAGFASEKLMVLLESRLDEEERKPREPKKAKKYLFE